VLDTFAATTLAMPNFQLVVVFWMVAMLCDGVDTPRMVGTLVKDSQEFLFSQPLVN
jgi:hypothetical protein